MYFNGAAIDGEVSQVSEHFLCAVLTLDELEEVGGVIVKPFRLGRLHRTVFRFRINIRTRWMDGMYLLTTSDPHKSISQPCASLIHGRFGRHGCDLLDTTGENYGSQKLRADPSPFMRVATSERDQGRVLVRVTMTAGH